MSTYFKNVSKIQDVDGDTYLTTEPEGEDRDYIKGGSQNGFVLLYNSCKLTGANPVNGPGRRFMYNSFKSAFRSGRVTNGQWDDALIGINSGAIGFNTIAAGANAWASGRNGKSLADESSTGGYADDTSELVTNGQASFTYALAQNNSSVVNNNKGSALFGWAFNGVLNNSANGSLLGGVALNGGSIEIIPLLQVTKKLKVDNGINPLANFVWSLAEGIEAKIVATNKVAAIIGRVADFQSRLQNNAAASLVLGSTIQTGFTDIYGESSLASVYSLGGSSQLVLVGAVYGSAIQGDRISDPENPVGINEGYITASGVFTQNIFSEILHNNVASVVGAAARPNDTIGTNALILVGKPQIGNVPGINVHGVYLGGVSNGGLLATLSHAAYTHGYAFAGAITSYAHAARSSGFAETLYYDIDNYLTHNILSIDTAARSHGYVFANWYAETRPGAQIVSAAWASNANGVVDATWEGEQPVLAVTHIAAFADASEASGYVTLNCRIESNGPGGTARGVADAFDALIQSNSFGSRAEGYATQTGQIIANGNGSQAIGMAQFFGIIATYDSGARAQGFSNGQNSSIDANAQGSESHGYAIDGGIITSSGFGSEASGMVNGSGSIVEVTGAAGKGSGYVEINSKVHVRSQAGRAHGWAYSGSTVELTNNAYAANVNFNLTAANVTVSGAAALVNVGGVGAEQTNVSGANSATVGRNLWNSNDESLLLGYHGKAFDPYSYGEEEYDTTGSFQIAGGVSDIDNASPPGTGISVVIGTIVPADNPVGAGITDYWLSGGADYAEMFEWSDGNKDNEDRIGYLVELDPNNAEKIRIAQNADNVVGVTTSMKGTSGFIGDTAELRWKNANLRDKFGRIQTTENHEIAIRKILTKHNIHIDAALDKVLKTNTPKIKEHVINLAKNKKLAFTPGHEISVKANNVKMLEMEHKMSKDMLTKHMSKITRLQMELEKIKATESTKKNNDDDNKIEHVKHVEDKIKKHTDFTKHLTEKVVKAEEKLKNSKDDHNEISNVTLKHESLIKALSTYTPIKTTVKNPNHDSKKKYVPRSARQEWTPVGLVGKLHVRDNGACKPGQRCAVKNGVAVPGNKWFVLKRVDTDVVQILMK